MDFGLSEEQDLLQSSAKEFLMQECPPPFVRALLDDQDGFSPELHRKMAELGYGQALAIGAMRPAYMDDVAYFMNLYDFRPDHDDIQNMACHGCVGSTRAAANALRLLACK